MITDISARTPLSNIRVLAGINAETERLGWGRIINMIPTDGVPREGVDAFRYRDENGQSVDVTAQGQAGMAYFRVRVTTRNLSQIRAAFDFDALGIEVNTPEVIAECDRVLGVWA